MNTISYKSNIPNIDIYIENDDIIIISKKKFQCLSNAAINGGHIMSDSIVNHHVSLDFDHRNLEDVLKPIKNKYFLSDSMIGLLTAVEMDEAILKNGNVDDIDYTFIVTAGLTNVSSPKIDNSSILKNDEMFKYKSGTINIILLVNCKMTEHAIVNLFIIITEGKVLILNMLNVRINEGQLATGTSTDTIVVGFTGEGQLVEWSGYATNFGQSIGQTLFKMLNKALKDKVNDNN